MKEILINDEAEYINDVEQDENIDPNHVFEHVRQLLLSRKVTEAMTYLRKTFTKLEGASEMENLSATAKEECLFAFLLKIFIESETKSTDRDDNANDAFKSEQGDNRREEIRLRKRVMKYLKNCLEFETELEKAIPMAENLLFSTCAGNAVESCTFLGVAFQFGVTGAADSMREALFQVSHRDQSVRNNVAMMYKKIYLDTNKFDGRQTIDHQIAVARANRLIELLKELKPGQSQALTLLIVTWYENKELNSELLQVLWEKFSMKYPDTSPIDSRTALMTTMIAQAKSDLASDNLDVLMKIGFGPRAKDDLLLEMRDACRMVFKIKQNNKDVENSPVRYPNDHDLFKHIMTLLIFLPVRKRTLIFPSRRMRLMLYHVSEIVAR